MTGTSSRTLTGDYLTAAWALRRLGVPVRRINAAVMPALPPGTAGELRAALAHEWALRTGYDGDLTGIPPLTADLLSDFDDDGTISLLEDALGAPGELPDGTTADTIAPAGNLVVLIGPAGSGKSALAAELWEPGEVISLDALRGVVSGDPCDQAATAAAAAVMHDITAGRLDRRLTTVIDATNTVPRTRVGLLAAADRYDVDAVAVVLGTPLDECLARNSTRPGPLPGRKFGRRVPEHVIRRQHAEMLAGLPGLRGEGFADVVRWPEVRS